MTKAYLDLPFYQKHKLSIDENRFREIKDELENFLVDENNLNTRSFARKVMANQEVKSNNTIEGIIDDLSLIEEAIKDAKTIKDSKQQRRIINLYNGYKYILTHRVIDSNHLNELYSILSDGLLDEYDLNHMGRVYREAPVYILKKGRLDYEPDQGLDYTLVPEYMNYYFDYINDGSKCDSITDYYIKSQIMHFYFVYIHPYFDVNGRTSRTMAMWYLLNNKAYPYIIFNRAINFDESHYDKAIMDTKKFDDVSFFVKYMMINVKRELEKEVVMREIKESTPFKLESLDYQTLIYYLSMNGEINVLNFATVYKRFNDYKKVKDIYEEMIHPLMDKGVFETVRTTNKAMFDNLPNEVFRLNKSRLNSDNPKIKRLSLHNK